MSAPSTVKAVRGPLTTKTVTIPNGGSLSDPIDLGAYHLARISTPAAWDAADLTFQASHDGVTFNNLHVAASDTEYTVQAGASRDILIPVDDFLSISHLKIRSGTSGVAVNQSAARSLVLTLIP